MATMQAPDIVRLMYVELVVTDLARAREFWVDLLGLHVTEETPAEMWLRGHAEAIHHNVILTEGPVASCAALGYRVRSEADLDLGIAWFEARGCGVRDLPAGARTGVGRTVRVEDPLGFTLDLVFEMDKAERLLRRWDLHRGAMISRIDHANLVVPDAQAAHDLYADLGFRLAETIEGPDHLYAAWMFRKPTVHDTAFTEGPGPLLHHVGFDVGERNNILNLADSIASQNLTCIERGPGRHGVSAAFYLYMLDPDGHRAEIYTTDYFTGDPDFEPLRWDVEDPRRRDYWGGQVADSFFNHAMPVLDLDGEEVKTEEPGHVGEIVVGADGLG
jgi:catechol 2,3-dioxygenase